MEFVLVRQRELVRQQTTYCLSAGVAELWRVGFSGEGDRESTVLSSVGLVKLFENSLVFWGPVQSFWHPIQLPETSEVFMEVGGWYGCHQRRRWFRM